MTNVVSIRDYLPDRPTPGLLARDLDIFGRAVDAVLAWPAYDIVTTDDETGRITVAVPGFEIDDLNVEAADGSVVVTGVRRAELSPSENGSEILYSGFEERAFRQAFRLDRFVEPVGATLENGLLHIDLERRAPASARKRKIAIAQPEAGRLPRMLRRLFDRFAKAV